MEVSKNVLCERCVKAEWYYKGNGQKAVRCKALKVPIGYLKGECWAFSDDPDFWRKYYKAIKYYREGIFYVQ